MMSQLPETQQKDPVVIEVERDAWNSVAIWLLVYGKILDKLRNLIRPQSLNIFQLRMIEAYEWAIASGVPCRIVGLKPRQCGGTTISAAICYHHNRRFASRQICIADKLDNSNNLFEMMQTFAEEDDYPWGFGVHCTQTRIKFENRSQVEKQSADNPKSGRSATIQALHASEVAYWPDTAKKSAYDTNKSLLGALAKNPLTVGIEESTPNGASGMFYELWNRATWPGYDGYWKRYDDASMTVDEDGVRWIRVFAAWWEFAEYRRSVPADQAERIMSSLTDRERRGIARYGWEVDQIAWRRWIMSTDNLSEDDFDAEYPEDPETCWLQSGRMRFDREAVQELSDMAKQAKWEYGNLTEQENGAILWSRCENPNDAGIWIHEHPRDGMRYVISVDTMTGEEDITSGVDYHAVHVIRDGFKDQEGEWNNARQVARIYYGCQLNNDPLSDMIDLLSQYYGRCIVAPEVNAGLGLIDKLRNLGVPMVKRRQLDKATGQTKELIGWRTDAQTRKYMIDELADVIVARRFDVVDTASVKELKTFIVSPSGKPEAASGAHDDDVIALAIGYVHLNSATRFTVPKRKPQKPADYYRWKRVGRR